MQEQYYYLLIDLAALSVPFLFSFHPRLKFHRHWKTFFPAMIATGAFFIVWDILFTKMGVWGFNPRYLTGISIVNLPLEEWLFFVCIPYACVFTYKCLQLLNFPDLLANYHRTITQFLFTMSLALGVMNYDKWYTATTFLFLAVFLLIHLKFPKEYFRMMLVSYLICLLPFFIVNGLLTGSWIDGEVVWYNDSENLSFRVGTIPFEDAFYGFLLIGINVSIMEWLALRIAKGKP